MTKLPLLSGPQVVKILCNKFGFSCEPGKGSHFKIKKRLPNGALVVTAVPRHSELAKGTLLGILKDAQVDREEFMKYV